MSIANRQSGTVNFRIIAVVVAVLATSALLAACGCNTVGCGGDGGDLSIDVDTLSQWIGHDLFTVEVCVDGDCQVPLDVDAVAAASSLGGDSLSFAVPEGASGDAVVAITVTSGTEVKHARGSVTLGGYRYRPNGRFCPPTCTRAYITIDDDVVRNRDR